MPSAPLCPQDPWDLVPTPAACGTPRRLTHLNAISPASLQGLPVGSHARPLCSGPFPVIGVRGAEGSVRWVMTLRRSVLRRCVSFTPSFLRVVPRRPQRLHLLEWCWTLLWDPGNKTGLDLGEARDGAWAGPTAQTSPRDARTCAHIRTHTTHSELPYIPSKRWVLVLINWLNRNSCDEIYI